MIPSRAEEVVSRTTLPGPEADEVSQRADLVSMTKPRITLMVMITTAAGYLLAGGTTQDWLLLVATLFGTGLASAGASALNQVVERIPDSRMERTADRPVPAGRLSVGVGGLFGGLLAMAGVAVLAIWTPPLTALLAAGTVIGYIAVYTPLKRVTSLSTIVGAVPGAIPPVMGWAAVTGSIDPGAWALFGILFVWQLPHFLAIAWMFREDYAKGGFPMLTVLDEDGGMTARQMILWCIALIPVSLAPSIFGLTGAIYFVAALALGLWFLFSAWRFARTPTRSAARRVLLVSVLYLPVVLAVMVFDRLPV